MTPDEARTVLGVTSAARPTAVRAAYRRLLRAEHPDHNDADDAGRRTAAIVEAYSVLRRAAEEGRPVSSPARLVVLRPDGDSPSVGAPADETYRWLLEAAHHLGEVTYVDRDCGILEAVLRFDAGGACSLVVSLQGRADGTTEAFFTLEPLGVGPAPPARVAVDAVVDLLRRRAASP